jgi:predicted DNA repair protein MutK
MLGGIYLAYEGVEKIDEYFTPHKQTHQRQEDQLTQDDILKIEEKKVKSAITTDFILSIEIVIIALGTVLQQPLYVQIIAVTVVAVLATIGIYGIVALLVRMDDFGFALMARADSDSSLLHKIGKLLVLSLPKVIRALTVIGTFAMLLVAGGIFMHNLHQLHDLLHFLPSLLAELFVGLVVGIITFGIHLVYVKLFTKN